MVWAASAAIVGKEAECPQPTPRHRGDSRASRRRLRPQQAEGTGRSRCFRSRAMMGCPTGSRSPREAAAPAARTGQREGVRIRSSFEHAPGTAQSTIMVLTAKAAPAVGPGEAGGTRNDWSKIQVLSISEPLQPGGAIGPVVERQRGGPGVDPSSPPGRSHSIAQGPTRPCRTGKFATFPVSTRCAVAPFPSHQRGPRQGGIS